MITQPNNDMGIFDAMYHCRAMRRLNSDPVPRELLLKLVDAAHQGPSASNAQNDRWLNITRADIKQKIADLNRAAIDNFYKPAPDAPPSAFLWQYDNLQSVPAIIIGGLVLDQKRDNFHAGYAAGGSIWPKVQNLLLAARALQLGACPTNLPLMLDRAGAYEALNVPTNMEIACVIPVGYPMGRFGPVTRRPVGKDCQLGSVRRLIRCSTGKDPECHWPLSRHDHKAIPFVHRGSLRVGLLT